MDVAQVGSNSVQGDQLNYQSNVSSPNAPISTKKDVASPSDSSAKGGTAAGPDADKPAKPHKPLNRVSRACNACRKQKMRCEGAENPPCRRCRHTNIECLFEKPVRDAAVNSEAGLERIRSLETQVTAIQSTLTDLVTALNKSHHIPPPQPPAVPMHDASPPVHGSSPHNFPQYPHHQDPSPPAPSPIGHSAHTPNGRSSYPPVGPSGSLMNPAPMGSHPNERDFPPGHHPGSGRQQPGLARSHKPMPLAAPGPMMHPGQPPLVAHPSQHSPQHIYPPQQYVPSHPSNIHPPMVQSGMLPPNTLPPFSSIEGPSRHSPQQGHPPPPPQAPPPPGKQHRLSGQFTAGGSPLQSPGPYGTSGSPHSQHPAPGGPPPLAQSHPHPHLALSPPHPHSHAHSHPHNSSSNASHHPPHLSPHQAHRVKMSGSSNVTSADSSDNETEFPASGLHAPLETIRAITKAVVDEGVPHNEETESVNGDVPGRSVSPSGREVSDRPMKRRKINHANRGSKLGGHQSGPHYLDVVAKGIITEAEARELFDIFYSGCSTFLPVFDAKTDTFDALHMRSPFCVDCICMVAAKVKEEGGPESQTYKRCLEEVQAISSKTLFAPVVRQEVVQAMVLVAGWATDGGWLSGGHAVRMAYEIGMHKAWPRVLKRINSGRTIPSSQEERELVISSRVWFCLYLFEHQLSFGNGRPAILREDESIRDCRLLLQHPLSIEDDMRLVSTVELMIIRERIHNKLSPPSNPPSDEACLAILSAADDDFQKWYEVWDKTFSQKYEDATFYRQSLTIQRHFAELFHNATALRGIRGPEDVAGMSPGLMRIAKRSITVAQQGLNLSLRSPAYREGFKYAVHYTHVTATFAASFLIRLARLFPQECNLQQICIEVEELADVFSKIPAGRYARTLRLMLRTAQKRRVLPFRTLPDPRIISPNSHDQRRKDPSQRQNSSASSSTTTTPQQHVVPVPQAKYGAMHSSPGVIPSPTAGMVAFTQEGLDQYVPGFELNPEAELPVWLSESNLGDLALSQYGLEAFLIPQQFDNQQPLPAEIW